MRKWICAGVLAILAVLAWGCQGVEPEKRAYPLVMAFDWEEGQYRVIYGMANLAVSTGQGKSAQDTSAGGQQTILFEGKNMEEIVALYNEPRNIIWIWGMFRLSFSERILWPVRKNTAKF